MQGERVSCGGALLDSFLSLSLSTNNGNFSMTFRVFIEGSSGNEQLTHKIMTHFSEGKSNNKHKNLFFCCLFFDSRSFLMNCFLFCFSFYTV